MHLWPQIGQNSQNKDSTGQNKSIKAIGGKKWSKGNHLKLVSKNFGLFHEQRFLQNHKIRIFREIAAV